MADQLNDDEPSPAEGDSALDGTIEDDPASQGVDPEFVEAIARDLAFRVTNRAVNGILTLHLDSRDVHLEMDGATALRALAIVAGRLDPKLRDRVDSTSSALTPWFLLCTERIAAISWHPDVA